MYCLQARPCIFQAGNLTGCGSEGVNMLKYVKQLCVVVLQARWGTAGEGLMSQ